MDTGSGQQEWIVNDETVNMANVVQEVRPTSYPSGTTEMTTSRGGQPGEQQQKESMYSAPLMSEKADDRLVFSWDYDDGFWWCKDKEAESGPKDWMPYAEYGSRPAKRPRWQ